VLAGCGSGSNPEAQPRFREDAVAMAEFLEAKGMAEFAKIHAVNGTRIQYRNKDPRGWFEFDQMLAEHSAIGSALTLRGVQAKRRGVYDFASRMSALTVPTLIIVGDEDEPCLEPSLFMKRAIPAAALAILPRTGHAVNLEEPALFNQLCADFLHQVETGRWPLRDPRAAPGRSIGIR
jgi:pimeloyl-ACP methyl ester carboxylesterase